MPTFSIFTKSSSASSGPKLWSGVSSQAIVSNRPQTCRHLDLDVRCGVYQSKDNKDSRQIFEDFGVWEELAQGSFSP